MPLVAPHHLCSGRHNGHEFAGDVAERRARHGDEQHLRLARHIDARGGADVVRQPVPLQIAPVLAVLKHLRKLALVAHPKLHGVAVAGDEARNGSAEIASTDNGDVHREAMWNVADIGTPRAFADGRV